MTKKKTPAQKAKAKAARAAARKAKVEPEFKVKRIRMLMSGANKDMAFTTGKSYRVPEEVPVKTAKSWLASGAAEEDKSLPDPPEQK